MLFLDLRPPEFNDHFFCIGGVKDQITCPYTTHSDQPVGIFILIRNEMEVSSANLIIKL